LQNFGIFWDNMLDLFTGLWPDQARLLSAGHLPAAGPGASAPTKRPAESAAFAPPETTKLCYKTQRSTMVEKMLRNTTRNHEIAI